jgi:hypothetical protein
MRVWKKENRKSKIRKRGKVHELKVQEIIVRENTIK